MMKNDGLVREQMRFFGQDPERLRAVRGHELYDTLGGLDLTHGQYFRALGVNVEDYCAQEFGVDLRNITVERFFASDPNTKWLFPDIVREAVLTGMRKKPVYPQLIARDENVTGAVVDIPFVRESEEDEIMGVVAEGAAIPESQLSYGDRVIRLNKLGRGVLASYEAVRRMSVDMLRVHLRRIGERLGRQLDGRLATLLSEGASGDASSLPPTINTATVNTLTYDDIVGGYLKLSVENGFTPTHMLANGETCRAILALEPFRDATLFDFARTGDLPTPLGMRLVPMEGHPDNLVTLLDAGYAAAKLTEQDLLVENDKLIQQQWERTVLTVVTDFAILYANARVVIRSNWS